MVALVRALGGFHVAQQRIHLFDRQLSVGAHGAVAGHGGQDVVTCALHHGAGANLCQVGQYRAGELGHVGVGQSSGLTAHHQGRGRERRHVQAQRQQRLGFGFGRCDLASGGGKTQGQQQGLCWQPPARARVERCLEPLVDDAFMRGVHVHDHQALAVFSKHPSTPQLRQRAAKRPGGLRYQLM